MPKEDRGWTRARGRPGRQARGPLARPARRGGGGGGGGGDRVDTQRQTGPVQTPDGLPHNWPRQVRYLTRPHYHGIAPRQRALLQTQTPTQTHAQTRPLPEIPPTLSFGPSSAVEIRVITDPAHPACGQRGLFARRHLAAGSFVLPYLGVYHRGHVAVGRRGSNADRPRESDYDLWLDRDADVAIDADRMGNEARFVNDYRGTGQPRANAEFREVWDPRRGERGMAVYVLPAGKRAIAAGIVGGIPAGTEILVSYGKGFWEMRQKEAAGLVGEGDAEQTEKSDQPDQDDQPDELDDQPDEPDDQPDQPRGDPTPVAPWANWKA